MPSPNSAPVAWKRGVLLAAACAALAGCKAVGPDFKTPVPPQAGGFAMQGDAVPAEVRLTADGRSA